MLFLDKLNAAIVRNGSPLVVGLDPNPEMLPEAFGRHGDVAVLWRWLMDLVAATADRVCAYKPTLGFYLAMGATGLGLLERLLAALPADLPVILDAKHSDLNTATALARAAFEDWRVDAVTLSPYAGQDVAAPFLRYPERAVFILCRTSNPAAAAIQGDPADEASPALQVVRTVQSWGTPEQVALEVGTAEPGVLARFRAAAPERLILLRSLWSGRDNLDALLDAGCDAQGGGLLVPVPQEVFQAADPGEAVAELRARVSRSVAEQPAACPIWRPDLCLLRHDPHEELILQLFDTGCILFGEYVQASGAVFPYYVDLRRVISNPQTFQAMIAAYTALLNDLSFDRIAGIPYGALPTATGLALQLNRPMIYPRKEVKAHGTRQVVEGAFQPGEKAVVVDDILISGKSALEGVRKLQSVGLMVEDVVVLIDHGGPPVAAKLAAEGLRTHAVLPFERIVETLYAAGRIDERQAQILEATG